jgi:hypothetical protein
MQEMSMWRETLVAVMATGLVACAAPSTSPVDFAARNRPLEERCLRAHQQRSLTRPDMTRAEVQAEARAAARRGELDKACDWL